MLYPADWLKFCFIWTKRSPCLLRRHTGASPIVISDYWLKGISLPSQYLWSFHPELAALPYLLFCFIFFTLSAPLLKFPFSFCLRFSFLVICSVHDPADVVLFQSSIHFPSYFIDFPSCSCIPSNAVILNSPSSCSRSSAFLGRHKWNILATLQVLLSHSLNNETCLLFLYHVVLLLTLASYGAHWSLTCLQGQLLLVIFLISVLQCVRVLLCIFKINLTMLPEEVYVEFPHSHQHRKVFKGLSMVHFQFWVRNTSSRILYCKSSGNDLEGCTAKTQENFRELRATAHFQERISFICRSVWKLGNHVTNKIRMLDFCTVRSVVLFYFWPLTIFSLL